MLLKNVRNRLALAGIVACCAFPAWADTPQVALDLLARAEAHRDAGRSEQAMQSFREALLADPSLVAAHASLGALYHSQGDFEAAYASFVEGLEQTPDDRGLLYNAAVLALRLERGEDALRWIDHALQGDPEDGELLSLRGAIFQRLGRTEEALQTMLEASRQRPKDAQCWFRLGNLQYQLGHKEEAVQSFRAAATWDRTLLRAYYNLGAVLFELGRDDEALEAYEIALEPIEKALTKKEPVEALHAKAYANLGAIHLRKENWQPALDAYEKALRLDPDQPAALYNEGFVLFRLGRHNEAEAAYQQALKNGAELPAVAYLHLGQMASKRQAHQSAIQWLERARPGLEDGAQRIEAWRLLADAHRELDQRAEAEQAWRSVLAAEGDLAGAQQRLPRLVRETPDASAAAQALALLDLRRGEAGAAERLLGAGEPLTAIEHANSGQALWLAGRSREALPHLEVAARDLPHHLGSRLLLGNLALAEGRFERAISQYESALVLCGQKPTGSAPGDGSRFELQLGSSQQNQLALCAQAKGNLGIALAVRGHERLAKSDGSAAVRVSRSDAERALTFELDASTRARALLVRGTAHALEGSWQAARGDLESALRDSLLSPELAGIARNNLAAVQYRLGDPAAARAWLGDSRALTASSLNRALLLDRAGDVEAALELYEIFLKDHPDRHDVASRVDQLRKFY